MFGAITSFAEIIVNGTIKYFVTDNKKNNIVIFDKNWEYLDHKEYFSPTYIKQVGNEVFITGESYFCKTDANLNISRSHNNKSASYHSFFYDRATDSFYVISLELKLIELFDRELSLIGEISMGEYEIYTINAFKSKFLLGTKDGEVLVLGESGEISKIYKICSHLVTSIIVDNYGFMAVSCNNPDNSIYLYHVNGTNMNINKKTGKNDPMFIKLDSNERLIVISDRQISIYTAD